MVKYVDMAAWPQRGPDLIFPADMAPMLAIVVHTEEEFDWNAPFDRNANTVRHVPSLADFQAVAERYDHAPHYSCGYPILADNPAVQFFKPLFDEGRATLGAHLHPWVCPPFTEDVNNKNSFPGNLPESVEREKITTLTNTLTQTFGIQPKAYLAGRYGYGPNTSAILAALGYEVDFSVAPGWDYRRHDGPNWRDHSAMAFFDAQHAGLLHVPHSGGHIGFLCKAGQRSLVLNEAGASAIMRLPSIAARLGAVRQARLTIEGMPLQTMIALAQALYAGGVRLFTLSFHSPSAAVGYTPYSPTESARNALLIKMEGFLRFFAEDLGGIPAGPDRFYAVAASARDTMLSQAA
ncbi:MAG: WalW protein [Pseudomonadota bacterium]